MNPRISLLAAIFFCLPASPLSAIVFVSNLGLEGAGNVGYIFGTTSSGSIANSFTTGSGPGWNVDSVSLIHTDPSTSGGTITVQIAADDGSGQPGSTLGSLTASGSSGSTYTYTPTSTITLAENTAYWLVAFASVDNAASWIADPDNTEVGEPGWSIGDGSIFFDEDNGWDDPGAESQLFSISATAVPESSAALMAGLGALALLRRKRRA